MTWVRIDDQFFQHPKTLAAGRDAAILFISGLCYCARLLTDGVIPKPALRVLAVEAGVKPSAATRLVDVGLWEDHDDQYRVHNYLEYQPSRDTVEENRSELSHKRAEAGRRGAAKRWQQASQTDGKPMATTVTNEWQDDGPIPSHPNSSSSSNGSSKANATLEEDLEQTCRLITQRKLDRRRDHGERDPNNIGAWSTAVTKADIDRLREDHRALRGQHPDWSRETIADVLEPDLAPRASNVPTAEETHEWLDQQRTREADAVPMPEHMRHPTTRSAR